MKIDGGLIENKGNYYQKGLQFVSLFYIIEMEGATMKLTEATAERLKNILHERGINQYYLYKNGGIPRLVTCKILCNS